MTPLVSIGLVLDYSDGRCRGMLRGIKQYAEARPHWTLVPIGAELRAVAALAKSPPQGLITWAFRKATLDALKRLGLPWVSVCGIAPDDGTPRVGPDDYQTGELAASHLLDLGLKHFGFSGNSESASAMRRESGFRETVGRAGYRVESYYEPAPWQLDPRILHSEPKQKYRSWLERLSIPVGIFAADIMVFQLSAICREMGRWVPDDVALVGHGNDEMICELAQPSLSSVAQPSEQVGYEAARLLDRLIAGEPPPAAPILLPPPGVVARQSSDIMTIHDPYVAAALRLIRRSGPFALSVKDVMRAISVSRRSLERRFRQSLGRGIFEEIQRVRIDRAASLLAGTDLSIAALAQQSGFSNANHLGLVFRREAGMTPSDYRRQFRNSQGRTSATSLARH
jgi:LacI family transcriptional regulator